jgi:hypothetical protein
MAKVSKFLKLDKNVLLEYIYDSENNISEAYDVLVNSRDKIQSYLATSTSGSNNTQGNSLFKLDNISNRFGKIDTSYYTFLQIKNYSTSAPIRHDKLRFHLPINWTFGEYLGFYVRVYAYDTLVQKTYDLSNFYFDMTDVSQSYLLNLTNPPLLFQEKLWGKNLTIDIPALSAISSQRVDGRPKENSINADLTSGSGFSLTSPIFVDFHFINNIQTVNAVTTYLLSPNVTSTVPQTPEFENLGLKVKHSSNGDFFEIFGTFNDTIAGFKQFIDDSVIQGHRYYVQYNITMYEQNIRGKTTTMVVTDNFNETIEFRPIIKYSTTTAIIDVEMRLIDAVDDTYIIRRASYGMLQDEVARYSLNLIKINLNKANKPKIYNIKGSIDPSLVGLSNSMGNINIGKKRLPIPPRQTAPQSSVDVLPTPPTPEVPSTFVSNLVSNAPSSVTQTNSQMQSQPQIQIEKVEVPIPIMYDRFNIVAKSENVKWGSENYYGSGKLILTLYPFDNILKFRIAKGNEITPDPYDLSGFSELSFVIKNDQKRVSIPIFSQATENNPKNGDIVFRIPEDKMKDVKIIKNTGVNLFYIIGLSKTYTSVIYSGLFNLHDDKVNISDLNKDSITSQLKLKQAIKLDPTVPSFSKPDVAPEYLGNISKEVMPKMKPSFNKDLIQKGVNPTAKPLNKPDMSSIKDKLKNKGN